jgi:hypothetical protein
MTDQRKQLIRRICVVGLCVLGAANFFVGHAIGASKPAEVREVVKVETKVEYQDRIVTKLVYRERKDRAKHVETRTEQKADGSLVTTRVEDSRTHTDGTGTRESDVALQGAGSTSTSSERTVRDRASWRASLSADWGSLQLRPSLYGATVERRVLGPVWLGVHGRTDRVFGLTVGIEF